MNKNAYNNFDEIAFFLNLEQYKIYFVKSLTAIAFLSNIWYNLLIRKHGGYHDSMKKIFLFVLTTLFVVASFGGCQAATTNGQKITHQDKMMSPSLTEAGNGTNTSSENIKQPEDQDGTFITDDNIQLQRHNYFYESINKNPYDQWLDSQLSEGIRAEKKIYAEYLSFWENELLFSIENGKILFDNPEEYNQWKTSIQQWLIMTKETLKIEIKSFNATLPQLEVIISYCEIIRQKAIDTKFFLYRLEYEIVAEGDIEIPIKWSPSTDLSHAG